VDTALPPENQLMEELPSTGPPAGLPLTLRQGTLTSLTTSAMSQGGYFSAAGKSAHAPHTLSVSLGHIVRHSDVGARPRPGHPLTELMLTRLAEGSRRGARTDDALIALAVEGGGTCGVISGGMCLLMEKTGLIDAVDVIYGTSSGALNGSFTASGQAALGATNYLEVASSRFANPLRMLTGRAVLDLTFLFDELIYSRKPYSLEGLRAGPEFRAICVELDSSAPQVLADFVDTNELTEAVRVSCSLPLLTDPAGAFRGKQMADGSLIESIPYATALEGGATHVLALRSHPESHRHDPYPRALIELARRAAHPAVAPLMQARPGRYNAEAEHLSLTGTLDPHLLQIVPAEGTRRIGLLELSVQSIRDGLAAGADAAAAAFGLPPVEVLWQPELYTRTFPGPPVE
jgi:predicted patatin/cPLA2 family phospholipase